ncbi:MAG TPA: NlpC/P60 family protein [Pseudonocardiaceae bacterium]|nr:NlpC/P60 family protein [Pseudonocardiaceae bacterium]
MVSHRLNRAARGVAAGAVLVALFGVTALPAVADPIPVPDPVKTDPVKTVAEVRELSRQAEVITEQWHLATDRLMARRADADRARSDVAAATVTADQARSAQQTFRAQVDRLTSATFEGVRISSLTAMLISDSPQQFMDQMSALDVLAVSNREALDKLSAAVARTEQAELAATDAETRAAVAELDAGRIAEDVAQARIEMGRQIALVQERLGKLTPDELVHYASEGFTDFPLDIAGDGIGIMALRAALTRQGAPYIWGAEGPGTFDCSGLVMWAYRQAGVILPRGSWDQARVGSPVVSGLLPGDLIALYSPVSHIGMYVGNGLYINAPQSGDVVKVARVPWRDVTAIRRIG